ncbi:TonB-dependent receptor [Paraprevotella xylaniphila]|nr:TonB-dependent receptor [Paraprevotella xylaniphila]
MGGQLMTFFKKIVIFVIFSQLFSLKGVTQGIIVQGIVRDAFDNRGLENAHVKILNSDSNVVALVTTEIPYTVIHSEGAVKKNKNPNSGAFFECIVPKNGSYTAVVSMMGYKTKRVLFHVPQDYGKKLEIGDIYLFQEQKALEEVTVAATKLKIYHSGDTLVYNADAFVLDKQNVLEDLVKMLPGVELRDGRVFANGRFVESIIISGKDVMPSDPMQLMKMLPAYIVDKLKFYDQQGEKSKTMGKDMHDASYVMDVYLKRDYHAAWLGNAQAGGGTQKRWEGLGFIMRFDDRQFFTISADANNIGRERENTDICTIESAYDDRDLTNHQLNLNYSYHPTDKLRFDVNGVARRQDTEFGVKEKQKLDLSNSTDIYKLYSKTSNKINDYYRGGMSMTLRPRKGLYGKLMYSFKYGKDTEESKGYSITSLRDINISDSVWLQIGQMQATVPTGITNIYKDSVLSLRHAYEHKAETEWHLALGGNLLKFKIDYDMHGDNGNINQRYINRVFEDEETEAKRKSLHDTQIKDVATTMQLEYNINYIEDSSKRGILTPYYTFIHKKAHDYRELVLFEPQNDGSEVSHIDVDNSRRIKEKSETHTLGLYWIHEMQLHRKGWVCFNGQMPIHIKDVSVQLIHETASNRQHKQYILLSPTLEMKWYPKADDRKGSITSLNLKGWCNQTTPKEIYLLNQTDTSDPLNTYMGNPELRKQTDLGLSLGFRHYFERNKHNTYATFGSTNTWNAIAIQSIYDKQNGTRTLMPVNVDGKYNISLECGYGMPLASNQTCWLNLSAGANYTRCANMMFDNSNNQGFDYMKLYGYRVKANLRWNNTSRNVEVAYTVASNGNGIISNADSNEKLQELTNSLSITSHLPAGINASVNCNFISRFGFEMKTLNRTFIFTDAHISKSIYKEKVELSLSAIDIFHQRKHVQFVMNGEGHIETMATQYIPAYVLASIRFNWSLSSKKKR